MDSYKNAEVYSFTFILCILSDFFFPPSHKTHRTPLFSIIYIYVHDRIYVLDYIYVYAPILTIIEKYI